MSAKDPGLDDWEKRRGCLVEKETNWHRYFFDQRLAIENWTQI